VRGTVHTLAAGHGGFYIGGEFDYAGGELVQSVAFWDGGNWVTLGEGIRGVAGFGLVTSLVISGNLLYVGGEFTTAGGSPARNVALWDGGEWVPLGSGLDNRVASLAVNESGDLYAAGNFTTAGSQPAGGIAAWDGASWSPLGTGVAFPFHVDAIALVGGDVIAGGLFPSIGGVAAENLALWDGASWSPLGGGTNGLVHTLAVEGDRIYVAGEFSQVGTTLSEGLAFLDEEGWHDLPRAFDGTGVSALVVSGDTLFVGGTFTLVGETPAHGLAMFDGADWSELGGGVAGGLAALSRLGNRFLAGGAFGRTGTGPGLNFSFGDLDAMVPVSLSGFRAARIASGVAVTWAVTEREAGAAYRIRREDRRVETEIATGHLDRVGEYEVIDDSPPAGAVRYWLLVTARDGSVRRHGPAELEALVLPGPVLALSPNHPNPFAEGTEIRFLLPESAVVRLEVFDARGRTVRRLLDAPLPAGAHEARWDGRSASGDPAAGGIYFVRLSASGAVRTGKMVRFR
jgi:hypothetical protein